ncbi:single-strand DNA-binding protein [Entomortierella parvispora]|uniref:Single-strand DNA-binding protein n=1 Tax=Entomortierella parvispora TaxID=205924 RepID=A0A9P3LWT2_9FUNG|nr:single-strand DNA-binding protein [Entomortierella parvispora]
MLLARINPVAKRVATTSVGAVRTLVNKATIVGRVGQDAEINSAGPERSVVHFSIATSENRKDAEGNLIKTTQWHRIVSWDQKKNPYLAERVKKGDLVFVEGPIHYRTYTGKDGTEKHLTEISMRTFQALSAKEPQQQ